MAVGLLVIAVSAFVFRKKLVSELINSTVSIVIPSAHAQSSGPITDEVLKYKELVSKFSTIRPVPGLLGFELQSELEDMPDECSEISSAFFMSSFILADISNENYFLKMNECLREDLSGKKWVLNYGAIQIPLTVKEKLLIDNVWSMLEKQKINLDPKVVKSAKKAGLTKLTNEINNLEKKQDTLSLVSKMSIYSSIGNFGKVDSLAREFIQRNEYFNFFEMEFPYASAATLKKQILTMLETSSKNLQRNKLFNAFILKIHQEASEEMKDEIEDELKVPSSSKELAAFYTSPNLGLNFPLPWLKSAASALDRKSFEKLLEGVNISKTFDSLSILRYYHPLSSDRRAQIFDKFVSLESASEPRLKSLYFEILKNDQWRKYFSSKKQGELKPFFKDKRLFYKKNIENNKGILFSTYKLFEMGDFQRDYFLKLLAVRSYGLPSTQILPL
ncbi:MAG: hypothetical protein KC478_00470 [Bacteriovoracaceae bacterium]|nr:hypothetical protein [Bacteriovoracaceae bacterium]